MRDRATFKAEQAKLPWFWREGHWLREFYRDCYLYTLSYDGWWEVWGWICVPFWKLRIWTESVIHIISWVPVLWKDRDWDHQYFHIMMREKLHRMGKNIYHHGMSADREKTAKQIAIAVYLLDRIIAHEYCEEWRDEFTERTDHRHRKWRDEKTGMRCSSWNLNKAESKEFKRICDHEHYMERQDLRYLGEWLTKKVKSWWD